MHNLERDELISAYLDDELSTVERAEVERWLAEDAGARRLLAELQGLRSTLHALPKVSLPADLADRVLRRAEREMLSGDHRARPAAVAIPIARREPVRTDDWRRFFPRTRRFWRPVGYVAATIAAALMLILLTEERNNELAIAPQARMNRSEPQLSRESASDASDALDQPTVPNTQSAPESPVPQAALRSRMSAPANPATPAAAMIAAGAAEHEALVVECQVAADTNGDELLLALLKKHQVSLESPALSIDQYGAVAGEAKRAYKAREPGGAMYVVHATRTQLDAVLAELHAESSPMKEIAVRTSLPADLENLKVHRGNRQQIAATEKGLAAGAAEQVESAHDSIEGNKPRQEPQVEAFFILRPAKPATD